MATVLPSRVATPSCKLAQASLASWHLCQDAYPKLVHPRISSMNMLN